MTLDLTGPLHCGRAFKHKGMHTLHKEAVLMTFGSF